MWMVFEINYFIKSECVCYYWNWLLQIACIYCDEAARHVCDFQSVASLLDCCSVVSIHIGCCDCKYFSHIRYTHLTLAKMFMSVCQAQSKVSSTFFSFDWLCCLARVLRTAVFSYAQQMFYVRCSKRSDSQIYQNSYHKWTRHFLELWSALFSEHAYFKPAK